MIRTELSLVTIVLSGFGLWVLGMFALSMLRGFAWRKQRLAHHSNLPAIREVLIDYLSGNEDRTRLREFLQTVPDQLAEAFMSFEGTVAGSARDRLCDLGLELALIHQWCEESRSRNVQQRRTAYWRLAFVCSYEPCRRITSDILMRGINDSDEEVRLAASRAMVYTGAPDDVERVFEYAVSQNPLNRILLSEELRPYAAVLCERAIPKVLKSGDPSSTVGMLQMVAAWERAVALPGIGTLLRSDNRQIRLLALQVAPLVQDSPEVRKAILDALADADSEIFAAAAGAAGRLRLEAALPDLARLLRTGDSHRARAAAAALGSIPPKGLVALQELTASPSTTTAVAAAEALSRTRGQR
ncbi:MAG TPA: HEAT repeat domain-containing protein [Candidatus Sulfopaludibacter sp.]|jgi:HEAT repeat protein|nr:HEAT repeat domain-containing protein [Candidatus Sulfopaludibacter sp.]